MTRQLLSASLVFAALVTGSVTLCKFQSPQYWAGTGSVKAWRGVASVPIPKSLLEELETRLVRQIMSAGSQEGEQVVRQKVRNALLDEFGAAESKQYHDYDELARDYKEASFDDFEKVIKKIEETGWPKMRVAFGAQVSSFDQVLKLMRARAAGGRFDPTKISLVKTAFTPTSVVGPVQIDQTIRSKFSAGTQSFVLYGNTTDMVRFSSGGKTYYASLDDYVENIFLKNRDVVISFDVASGVRFRDEASELVFKEWLEGHTGVAQLLGYKNKYTRDQPLRLSKSPGGLFPVLDSFFNSMAGKAKVTFKIEYADAVMGRTSQMGGQGAEDLAEAAGKAGTIDNPAIEAIWMRKWANNTKLQDGSFMSILIADHPHAFESVLQKESRIAAIKIPRPEKNSRLEFINRKISDNPSIGSHMDMSPEHFARDTSGYSLEELDIMLNELAASGDVLTTKTLSLKKLAHVESRTKGMYVGIADKGLGIDDLVISQELKDKLKGYVTAWKNGDIKGLPQGIFQFGTRGMGKTAMAGAICRDLGILCVEMKNFFNSYVGGTEKNIELLIEVAKDSGPVLVFMDEFSKKFIGTGGGGTQQDIMRQVEALWLPFMADDVNRGRVLFVGAAADTALFTHEDYATRFDVLTMLGVARTTEERKVMMASALKYNGLSNLSVDKFPANFFEMMTKVRTPRDYSQTIALAHDIARREGRPIDESIISLAFREKAPNLSNEVVDAAEKDFVAVCPYFHMPKGTATHFNKQMPIIPSCDGAITMPF